jgi:hypothetical protein
MTNPTPPADLPARIDVTDKIRDLAGSLGTDSNRVVSLFTRHWTTPLAVDEAETKLLAIAEAALALRRQLRSELLPKPVAPEVAG